MEGESGEQCKYHRPANLEAIWRQVHLAQKPLDVFFGSPGAFWEQHAEVADKILTKRNSKKDS